MQEKLSIHNTLSNEVDKLLEKNGDIINKIDVINNKNIISRFLNRNKKSSLIKEMKENKSKMDSILAYNKDINTIFETKDTEIKNINNEFKEKTGIDISEFEALSHYIEDNNVKREEIINEINRNKIEIEKLGINKIEQELNELYKKRINNNLLINNENIINR